MRYAGLSTNFLSILSIIVEMITDWNFCLTGCPRGRHTPLGIMGNPIEGFLKTPQCHIEVIFDEFQRAS